MSANEMFQRKLDGVNIKDQVINLLSYDIATEIWMNTVEKDPLVISQRKCTLYIDEVGRGINIYQDDDYSSTYNNASSYPKEEVKGIIKCKYQNGALETYS